MIPISKMSRAELGAFVQKKLRSNGIDVVLSGGACASIYSNGIYVSMDLDMIHRDLMLPKRSSIKKAMTTINNVWIRQSLCPGSIR